MSVIDVVVVSLSCQDYDYYVALQRVKLIYNIQELYLDENYEIYSFILKHRART